MYAVSALIGLIISGVVTWLQRETGPGFFEHWWRAAGLSLLVMLPSGGLVMAFVSKLVRRVLAHRPTWMQRVVMALGMGLSMEAIASALSTITNLDGENFLSHWVYAYWHAAPLALVIGPVMAFVVRPWVERRLAQVEPHAGGAA
jgi:Protein of unknown function (DUF2798)